MIENRKLRREQRQQGLYTPTALTILGEKIDPVEVEIELSAQIKRAIASGIQQTHMEAPDLCY